MMKKFILIISLSTAYLLSMQHNQDLFSNDTCNYVLSASKLRETDDEKSINLKHTYDLLHTFFMNKGIKDYTDAAQFGRSNNLFDNPEKFSTRLGSLLVNHSVDQCPSSSKQYQALVLNTSGIDVFTERLAFLARLTKSGIQADNIIALIGSHAHRKDLMDPNYLVNLVTYFKNDFDLTKYDEKNIHMILPTLLNDGNWTHKDGMNTAWQLVSCDESMAELSKKFQFYPKIIDPSLRTEQLMEHLLQHGLKHPITNDHPIAFICNAQGATKTKEMVDKIFHNYKEYVDILVSKPANSEIEEKVFNDTPSQRAMTKLFHYYRILEVKKDNL